MNIRRFLLPALLLMLGAFNASAQVSVDLKFAKKSFLQGEPIPVVVSLTNLSGRDLTFAGTPESAWLDFIVNSTRGVPLTSLGKPAFGKVTVPSGKTFARTIDLNRLYAFRELGNFSVYGIVRLPGQGTNGYQSKRHLFTVSTAKPYWRQVVGVPGKSQTNEFRLIQFTGDSKNQLYAQVADVNTGSVLKTHHLGEFLMFRKPTITVGGDLTMNVLYLITPTFWGHAKIDPTGKFLGRDLYKPTANGDPHLAKNALGQVIVVGGIPYDAKAEAAKRAKERKASDRPDFIYE